MVMIQPDVLEQLNLFSDNAMSAWAIYLTLTFSYLTAFYVAGTHLSRLQSNIISLLYLIWSLSFALVAMTHIASIEKLVAQFPEFVPSALWHLPWLQIGAIISFGGMLTALFFAYDIRRGVGKIEN